MIQIGITAFGAVYASWFVCTACGFVETWVENNEDLKRIDKKFGPQPSS